MLWEATGQIGAKRLQPFVPELLARLTACGELQLPPPTATRLQNASVSTLERLLAPAQRETPRRGLTTTRPGAWLKQHIPIRTFADWDDAQPGFLEVDLVAHCGGSGEGFFLHTLAAVDVATSWVELEPIWGKGHYRVGAGVQEIRARLPVPLRGLDSDNGSEFINRPLYYYCHREGITFTRSRAYRKNHSAHLEQKNGAIVRQLIGYDRYASKAAYAQLARVYRLVRLHTNFFQPVQRLLRKTRVGARSRWSFDSPVTAYDFRRRTCNVVDLDAARRPAGLTTPARGGERQLANRLPLLRARGWPPDGAQTTRSNALPRGSASSGRSLPGGQFRPPWPDFEEALGQFHRPDISPPGFPRY